MKPVNYAKLMTDSEYKYYLRVLIFYNDYIVNESKAILTDIEKLVTNVDQEIQRME
jgi:hypothetical protein